MGGGFGGGSVGGGGSIGDQIWGAIKSGASDIWNWITDHPVEAAIIGYTLIDSAKKRGKGNAILDQILAEEEEKSKARAPLREMLMAEVQKPRPEPRDLSALFSNTSNPFAAAQASAQPAALPPATPPPVRRDVTPDPGRIPPPPPPPPQQPSLIPDPQRQPGTLGGPDLRQKLLGGLRPEEDENDPMNFMRNYLRFA
jgi:hypothetical protein